LYEDARRNWQNGGNAGIYIKWIIRDFNGDGKVSLTEVKTMESLWREDYLPLEWSVASINNW
jgi:hypothetical protein